MAAMCPAKKAPILFGNGRSVGPIVESNSNGLDAHQRSLVNFSLAVAAIVAHWKSSERNYATSMIVRYLMRKDDDEGPQQCFKYLNTLSALQNRIE